MLSGMTGALAGNYILVSAVLLLLDSLLVFDILRRRSSGSRSFPKGASQRRDDLMQIVRGIESCLNGIDFAGIGEAERKWYNKLNLELESIKRSIDSEDMQKAKRALGSAELYLKMLELSMVGR
jgi:hypothetical protein